MQYAMILLSTFITTYKGMCFENQLDFNLQIIADFTGSVYEHNKKTNLGGFHNIAQYFHQWNQIIRYSSWLNKLFIY